MFKDGFEALKKAVAAAEKIRHAEHEFDKAELKLQLSELMSALADTKMSMLDMNEQLQDKEAMLVKLRRENDFRHKTVRVGGDFYEASADGKPMGLPFCPRCLSVDSTHIRLEYQPGKSLSICYCPKCKAGYAHKGDYEYRT